MPNGIVQAGGRYYAYVHAYLHLIFEVVEMLGPQRARVKNCRFVYSSQLNWTDFFAKGYTLANSVIRTFPDGEVSWYAIFDWPHEIL